MDAFTADYLANLSADLTAKALGSAGRRLRETVSGTEGEQALERCFGAAIVALLATASTETPEETNLLADIFRSFFDDLDVAGEMASLLKGKSPDADELIYLFEEAGYDPDTLPGLEFERALAAFEAAFLTAAMEEPALQGTIQTGQLLAQTRLQRELLDSMRELVDFVRQAQPGSLGIRAGQITAQNVVSGVQVVYQLPQVGSPYLRDSWEGHYLRTLISQCDPLDLTPFDETHPQSGLPGEVDSVCVSDVFTTLYLRHLARTPRQTVAEAIQGRDAAETVLEKERDEERLPIQAVEAVGALPRLVILGQPGGGKSTLVNHVATQLARRRLGEAEEDNSLVGWPVEEKPLPVRIILRRFAAWLPADEPRGRAGQVWKYLEHQLDDCGCKEAFERLHHTLTEEGGVVFFDGLDEVRETDAEGKRSLIKEAVAEFARPLHKCRVVVTCREYAYNEGDAWRLPGVDFPVVELALFNLDQVKYFTQTWYRVVGPQKGWGADKCQDEASNLYQAIQDWPHLQELAQYPLLLTLMAQVHGRDGTLPQDRAGLYERAVNLLLSHWENRIVRDVDGARRVEPGLVMQLGVRAETLRAALERVAFDAHQRQEREKSRSERAADIPREELRDVLGADLGSLDKAEHVIAYIQDRAGLLQARGHRTYTFPHRTFQEYLAATYIMKQSAFDAMLRDRVRRDLPWWREVFLLAAGALSSTTPRNISDLVDGLLPMGPDNGSVSSEKAEQARLAAQSLRETGFAAHVRKEEAEEPGRYSATYQRVQTWLLTAMRAETALSARERTAAGDALARLSDPRFRPDAWYLPDEPLLGFLEIPAGPFLMGTQEEEIPAFVERFGGDQASYEDETPRHSVDIPAYYMARYPVTVAQYRAFVEEGRYRPSDPDSLRGLDNHPVVWVSWHDARAYCDWLTGQLRAWEGTPEPLAGLLSQGVEGSGPWEVRLPTEAEWEKAARGTDGGIFPWGDRPDPNRANFRDTGINATSAVGCFPGGASPFGVQDMSGNVDEWCHSLYVAYPYDPGDGRDDPRAGGSRVLRGGAFLYNLGYVRCAFRDWYDPGLTRKRYRIGFRPVLAPGFL